MISTAAFFDELEKIAVLAPGSVNMNPASFGGRAMLGGVVPQVVRPQKTPASSITVAALRKAQQTGGAITASSVKKLGSATLSMLMKLSNAAHLTPQQVGTLARRRTMPGSVMPLQKMGTGLGMPGMSTPSMGSGMTKGLGMPRLGNAIHPAGGAGMGPKPPVPPTGKGGMR